MKVQNPIIGRARGSAGGMTFCKNYDKNVARAKAFEVSNPNTQAQKTQRAFFAELTVLCADFSDEQLRTLFPSKPKTMSRRNALAKQIAQSYEVNGTEKTIFFADIDTLGNAPVMDFLETEFSQDGNIVSIILDERIIQNPSLSEFDFIGVFINIDKGQIYMPNICTAVSDGILNVEIPTNWGVDDSISGFPLITNSKGNSTGTVSFGTLSVTKRPARKND